MQAISAVTTGHSEPSRSSLYRRCMSSSDPPLLERLGVRSLERRASRGPGAWAGVSTDGVVHVLDDKERAALRRIERATVARAGLAGLASALVSAGAEILVLAHQQTSPLLFWLVVLGGSAAAAVAEIAFLSADSLRAVYEMSIAAGAELEREDGRRQTLAILARAALELPDPSSSHRGIDPYRESRRTVLLLAALVYKLKVSATNIVLKQLVRRALGRAAVRAWLLPLVAIPGTVLWNVLTCRAVLREARIRVVGPSLAADTVARLVPAEVSLSPLLAEALPRAVGACVVRTAALHPNLERLLELIGTRAGGLPPRVDDSRAFLQLLPRLDPDEQAVALRFLRAAAVIDGKLTRAERRLLAEADSATGRDHQPQLADAERRRVLAGERLTLS